MFAASPYIQYQASIARRRSGLAACYDFSYR